MVEVGGSVLSLLFLDQTKVVSPGEAFTKNRDILEGSKAGRLSRMPAPSRMQPRLWKTNLTAQSADTLPKKATVDMRTSVPSTTQASTGLLCETAFSVGLEGARHRAAVYFPPHLSPPHSGFRVVFHHWGRWALFLLIRPPEPRLEAPVSAPSAASWVLGPRH